MAIIIQAILQDDKIIIGVSILHYSLVYRLSLIRGRRRERVWQKHGNVSFMMSTIFPDSELGVKPRVTSMGYNRVY